MEGLQHCWDVTGGRCLRSLHRRRQQKRSDSYWVHQHKGLVSSYQKRPRKLSTSTTSPSQTDTSSPLLNNPLLSLPAEIRALIWEHAFGGNLIAIFRDNGRLTHTLLDESNSQVCISDVPVQLETIRAAVTPLQKNTTRRGKRLQQSTKLNMLASLQCCRTMHVAL
jgi:hypothetical protein